MTEGGDHSPPLDRLYTHAGLVGLYDALNTGRQDFDFYRARLPAPGARVLDIGCGTGTFAIELARAGYVTTGLDPSSGMIARARSKPGAEDVTWLTGMLADLPETPRFDAAIMTGHAFQCLLEDGDIMALFGDVARRMAHGGRFFFETRNRGFEAWILWDGSVQVAQSGVGQVARSVLWVRGDKVCFEERYTLTGQPEEVVSRSTLRFASLEQIAVWLGGAGLQVLSVHGDWSGGAFDPGKSPEIILETGFGGA